MIADEFKEKRHLYERLALAVRPLLERLALENKIEVAVIEQRVKEQDSLESKIARPDKAGKYHKLDDITDLCGLRIVLFTNEDCKVMSDAISENFAIDSANSIIKGVDYEEDRFGYLSTHLIAALPRARLNLFEFRQLANLKMEIQIRTVLQHAWAVLDWKLRYKTEREVPRELRRKLFRISALLEAADDAFSDLLYLAKDLRAEYDSEIRQGKFVISINKDSLESFLLRSEAVQDVLSRCEQRGVSIQRDTRPDTAYDYLISSLAACGINTLDQFEERLRAVRDNNIDDLVAIAGSRERSYKFGIFTPLRILMISQLEVGQRHRVLADVPTGDSIGDAEEAHFSGLTHEAK
jgi:putative GTP pyrophosphokinase